MTAALQCDGPSCSHLTTDPKTAEKWWRVQRQLEGIDEPGQRLAMLQPLMLPTIEINTTEEDLVDLGDDVGLSEDELPDALLHFATTQCMAEWAELAASVERFYGE